MTVQFRAVGPVADAAGDPSDVTVQFRAVGPVADAAGDPSDVTVQFRAVGPVADAAGDPSDVTVQFRAVGPVADAAGDPSDATVQFRAVGPVADAADELSDATMQFPVIGPLANPIMPFRVIGQPAYGPGHVDRDQGQAELRSLMHSVMAGLRPREREVIELSFRHDLNDNDLAIVLGVSQSRAHDLAARARSRLEEALGALHIALTGREACPVLGELLADWDGQLTEQTRDLVAWHIGECQTCAHHGWGAMRPAAFFRLLPLAPLPQELREQVLSLCTSTAEDAVAYRRRVARHAEWIWFARFSRAIRQASWSSIRANPGVAIAAVAVAVWVVAAVSVTLLTFAGSRAADAQTPDSRATHPQTTQTSVATHPGSPATATPSPATSVPPGRPLPLLSPPPTCRLRSKRCHRTSRRLRPRPRVRRRLRPGRRNRPNHRVQPHPHRRLRIRHPRPPRHLRRRRRPEAFRPETGRAQQPTN